MMWRTFLPVVMMAAVANANFNDHLSEVHAPNPADITCLITNEAKHEGACDTATAAESFIVFGIKMCCKPGSGRSPELEGSGCIRTTPPACLVTNEAKHESACDSATAAETLNAFGIKMCCKPGSGRKPVLEGSGCVCVTPSTSSSVISVQPPPKVEVREAFNSGQKREVRLVGSKVLTPAGDGLQAGLARRSHSEAELNRKIAAKKAAETALINEKVAEQKLNNEKADHEYKQKKTWEIVGYVIGGIVACCCCLGIVGS